MHGRVAAFSFAVALVICASPASAYRLEHVPDGGPMCPKDGSTCNVKCDNGNLAGSMNWSYGVWTDGVKSDPDMDVEARKICAANGSGCI
jgi:hypothetical protein